MSPVTPAVELGAGVIVAVFVWSGGAKLRSPQRAGRSFVDLGLLTSPSAGAAVALSLGELAAAVGILAPGIWVERSAAGLAVVLFAGFTVVNGLQLRRSEKVSCFCFGGESEEVGAVSFARAVALFGIAAAVVARAVLHAELWPDGSSRLFGLVGGVGTAALAAVVVVSVRELRNGLTRADVLAPLLEFNDPGGAA